jgi:hypothetical protein
MVLASRLSRPLQRRCTQCRRVQEVRLPSLYHVVVPNKGGGTRRDGGYDCRFCGTANAIPANEMPQGLLVSLPSHAELIASAAAAAEPVASAASDGDGAGGGAVSAVAAVPTPAQPRRVAKSVPPPVWIVGAKARATLLEAFARATTTSDGLCAAFVRTAQGPPMLVDPRGRMGDDDILDWLDRTACELLILGGSGPDGSRWKAIFHPIAGAATLAIEPAIEV